MAVRDDIRAQREKLKGAPLKKKLGYFLYYYKIQLIVAAVIAIAVISFVHSQLLAKPDAFTVMLINAENPAAETDALEKETAEKAGINLGKNSITLDLSNTLTPGGPVDQADYATFEKVQSRAINKGLDMVSADAWNFRYFALQSYFCDLRDVFSSSELDKYSDDIYYIDKKELDEESEKMDDPDYTPENVDKNKARSEELISSFKKPDPSEMDNPVPVGFIINDSSYVKENGVYSKTVGVIGVIDNAPHKKSASAFVKVLLDSK